MERKSLKTVNPYFTKVWDGLKTAELRFNDRDFQVGQQIWLDEYLPNFIGDTARYTGRHVLIEVTDITSFEHFPQALKDGWLMLSFKVLEMFKEDAML